jgi:CHASE2 domain-containing sensor protein/predicted Ser/Thr protein kinase
VPRPFGRRTLLLAVVAAAAAVALVARGTGALDSLERKTVDARLHVRGDRRPARDIVIVSVDQKSLSQLRMAPDRIPRTLHAALINQLHRDGARLIAYDVQFVGQKDSAGDAALKRAISAARPVLLATHDTDAGPVPVPAGERDPARLGAVIGSVGVPTDSDGSVRRMLYAPVTLKTFDVRAAELLLGHPVAESNFPHNSAWVDYAGPPGTFPTISISDAASGRIPSSSFRNKVVLVGYTDPALMDLVQTPVSSTPMAGVEVHANALATILAGFPLQPAPGWVDVLLILALAAVPGLLALRLPALYVLAGSFVALILLLVGVQVAFNSGRIVSLLYPVLGLVLSGAGSATVDALMATRELRSLSESIDRLVKRIGPGDVIGDYRVEELVGRGGMGVVYRATQQSLERPVALKVIVPELADDPEFRARFERESLAAASIDHPNVVPVYEAGEEGNLLFLAMRFIDGVDLRALLESEGPLAPARASHVIVQVASALAAAHARGLVHRDVKPANVLVDTSAGDHAYLTDFGLTRRVDSTTAVTQSGMMMGTLDYIPPEQINGQEVDPRADVYALGCVLYEVLTGRVPFERDSEVAKLFAHVSSDVPSARARRPELTDRVDEVIRRAMAKRPDERYTSVQELAHAVTASLAEVRADASTTRVGP